MHPLFQSFKRCYWSSMRFSRHWMVFYTDAYRITPARLDMLIAIDHAPNRVGIAQLALRRTLDVSAPVITVMLDSLEELGYVVRSPHPHDRRMKWIHLTARAREILEEIVDSLLLQGTTEYDVRLLLSPDPAHKATTERVLARTRRFLRHLRARVFDASTLVYPAYVPDGDRSPAYPYCRRDHIYVARRPRRPRTEAPAAA